MVHSDILSRLPHYCSRECSPSIARRCLLFAGIHKYAVSTRWSLDSSSLPLLMQATFPLLLALLSVASAQAPAPIIDVGNARYQGSVNAATNISSYLGIRYAAAPIGDLRFRAPQNPPVLDGVQQATTEPQQCLQAGSGNSPSNPNPTTSLRSRATQDPEDCLFLKCVIVHLMNRAV